MQLTVKDTAGLLGVSEKTIYRWLEADAVPHVQVGDQYRFNRAEVLAWAASAGRRLEPDAVREPESEDGAVPTLRQALEQGGIYYRIGGRSPAEALREIASVMRLPEGVDRDYLADALVARESLGSTAIGDGVAAPHMRYQLPDFSENGLTLCFLAEPVDWGALDGKPVRAVFVPCCATVRAHLHLLRTLSFALRDARWRALLDAEALRGDILDGADAVLSGANPETDQPEE